jgi:hypothetical protein
VSWTGLFREALVPALAPLLPAVVVLHALQAAVQPDNWLALGAVAAAGGLTYALVYFVFRATATEREMVWNLLNRAVSLARARS